MKTESQIKEKIANLLKSLDNDKYTRTHIEHAQSVGGYINALYWVLNEGVEQ